jgi:hypothetical protein
MHKKREIHRIRYQEHLKRVHQAISRVIKSTNATALSRIDIPATSGNEPYPIGPDPKSWSGAWSSLTEPKAIAQHVYTANCRKYSQAQETPFGQELLLSYLGDKGDAFGAKQLINGALQLDAIMKDLIPETQAILTSLATMDKTFLHTHQTNIDPHAFLSFYKTLLESTSSSPSGMHIGHYKVAADSEYLIKTLQ